MAANRWTNRRKNHGLVFSSIPSLNLVDDGIIVAICNVNLVSADAKSAEEPTSEARKRQIHAGESRALPAICHRQPLEAGPLRRKSRLHFRTIKRHPNRKQNRDLCDLSLMFLAPKITSGQDFCWLVQSPWLIAADTDSSSSSSLLILFVGLFVGAGVAFLVNFLMGKDAKSQSKRLLDQTKLDCENLVKTAEIEKKEAPLQLQSNSIKRTKNNVTKFAKKNRSLINGNPR